MEKNGYEILAKICNELSSIHADLQALKDLEHGLDRLCSILGGNQVAPTYKLVSSSSTSKEKMTNWTEKKTDSTLLWAKEDEATKADIEEAKKGTNVKSSKTWCISDEKTGKLIIFKRK